MKILLAGIRYFYWGETLEDIGLIGVGWRGIGRSSFLRFPVIEGLKEAQTTRFDMRALLTSGMGYF
jgi:hypothetical protein